MRQVSVEHDVLRSALMCGETQMSPDCYFHHCLSVYGDSYPYLGESYARSSTAQFDAPLNEQRIMLATSVERALKNSCFVFGMAVV